MEKYKLLLLKGEKLQNNAKAKLFRRNFKPELNCGGGYILCLFEGENKLVKFNYMLGEFYDQLSKKN